MKRLRVLALLICWFGSAAYAQVSQSDRHVDSVARAQVARSLASASDSIAKSMRLRVDSAYVKILEQTNAQLYMGWTPTSVFIAANGVLIALGAIVAGYLLYRQSKDFTDKLKTSESQLTEANRRLADLESKYREKLDESVKLVESINTRSTQLMARLEQAPAEAKPVIEAELTSLAALRGALAAPLTTLFEIRTPFNAIVGYSQLLNDGVYGKLTEKQQQAVLRIIQAGTHGLSRIEDIVESARQSSIDERPGEPRSTK